MFGSAGAQPWVASSKPFLGHLIGAAGIVETILCIHQLERGRLHGNPNLERPDPDCPARLVGREAITQPLRIGAKNSFGFGGGNATLILGKYED